MKKYKYIAGCLTLSLSLTMTSCDNFLDVDLDNQMQMDEVFAKRNTLERYFAHIYSFVYQPYDFHGNAIGACVPMSDEATFSWLSGLGYHSVLIGNWSVATGDYAMWKQMYTGINQATVFLDNADQCNDETLSRQEIEVMKAEVRFLRAWFYNMLVFRFGPVYIWGDQAPDSNIKAESVDRHTLERNIEFIVSEYDKAAAVLPTTINDSQWYGRVTKGAVLAAKSRFLLHMASPLFNGCNLYKGIQNMYGEYLFPQSADPNKWEEAAKAAKAVIDLSAEAGYELMGATPDGTPNSFNDAMSAYKSVFLDKWNKEMIWARWQTDGMYVVVRCNPPRYCTTGYGGYCPSLRLVDTYPMAESGRFPTVGYKYGSDGYPAQIDPKSGYQKDGFTENWTHPLDNFLPVKAHNSCIGRDARFYTSVLANGFPWLNPAMDNTRPVTFFSGGTSSYTASGDAVKVGFSWRKFTDPSLNTNQGNWGSLVAPIFRLAEIYLNYAEACNEKPNRDEAEALRYINKVRNRAGLKNLEQAYPEVVGNQTLMRELIQKERMVELAFETQRLYDLDRWMLAETVLNDPVYTLNVAANSYEDSWNRTTTVWSGGARKFEAKNYLFPIPQTQLDEMKNLTQNYGW